MTVAVLRIRPNFGTRVSSHSRLSDEKPRVALLTDVAGFLVYTGELKFFDNYVSESFPFAAAGTLFEVYMRVFAHHPPLALLTGDSLGAKVEGLQCIWGVER